MDPLKLAPECPLWPARASRIPDKEDKVDNVLAIGDVLVATRWTAVQLLK